MTTIPAAPQEETPASGSAGNVGGERYGPAMTDVDDRIDSLKKDVRAVSDSVVKAARQLQKVEAIVTAHDARFDDLQHMMALKFGQAEGRLMRINQRLDGHDDRFDRLDFRLSGIDGRLDGMDARLYAMTAEFSAQLTEILARLPQPPQ
jgi:hypothetical protein